MKFMEHLKPFGICLLIVGAILALIGLYYALLRAGSADPAAALDQQMDYLINMRIGGVLFWYGLIIIAAGIMSLLLRKVALTRR